MDGQRPHTPVLSLSLPGPNVGRDHTLLCPLRSVIVKTTVEKYLEFSDSLRMQTDKTGKYEEKCVTYAID